MSIRQAHGNCLNQECLYSTWACLVFLCTNWSNWVPSTNSRVRKVQVHDNLPCKETLPIATVALQSVLKPRAANSDFKSTSVLLEAVERAATITTDLQIRGPITKLRSPLIRWILASINRVRVQDLWPPSLNVWANTTLKLRSLQRLDQVKRKRRSTHPKQNLKMLKRFFMIDRKPSATWLSDRISILIWNLALQPF